jgi:signal transduction histidine kinase
LDRNDLETIFDKFYQSNNQNIKKPVGSGLGLSISKQIIEYHKGTIWAKEQENGACIVFTLPAIPTEEK